MGALVFIYGSWFLSNQTPPDYRFDQRRDELPADVPGPRILREQVADFRRQSFVAVAPDALGIRRGSAVYSEFDPRQVVLEVQQIAPEAGKGELTRRFNALLKAGRTIIHLDAHTPYLFHAENGTMHSEFVWVNGGWLFRVFTAEADAEALLRFVNNYPY